MTERSAATREVTVPAMGLILLVGVSGSGKSTFAARHFAPTEVVSSDTCRGLVADDESDQSATPDAFDLLNHLVGIRLRRGLLTVVDATNVQRSARAELVALAKSHDVLVDALVLDVPEPVAVQRNRARTDRDLPARVVTRQHRDLTRSLRTLKKEGFRRVHVLRSDAEIDGARIARERPWNDRRDDHGPFDVVGDVHGCAAELVTLLGELGYAVRRDELARPVGATHPDGRRAVFVGDLVGRGPDTPGVLRLVMGMVADGDALSVCGNHEAKLVRALRPRRGAKGAAMTLSHGLAESLEQLAGESEEFREQALAFMDGLIAHYVLDDGALVVAHAGLREDYHGRSSARVRAFALYGDTSGETDEYGLPVRYPWAQDYRGAATVVYGHTPVPRAEWVGRTICVDTGVVFGGELTALRYPERELVAVPAEREWYAPVRPLADEGRSATDDRAPTTLRADDVMGTRWVEGPLTGRLKVEAEQAAAAVEVLSRYAVDPRWLVHLPPTMSPVATSSAEGYLERPEEAFAEMAGWGVEQVVCEEKHMGSRAIAVLARDAETAHRRFGVTDGSTGALYTRTGRDVFPGALGEEAVARLREAAAPLLTELGTDWLVLDGELLPWSAKSLGLVRDQYASVGAAALHALPAALDVLGRVAARGHDVADLADRTAHRLAGARAYQDAWTRYVTPTDGLDGVRYAPFHVLAGEGEVPALTRPHPWHMERLGALDHPFVQPTRHRVVDLASPEQQAEATAWWEELTAAGGEGMVVKPAGDPRDTTGRRGTQPGLKVRGREYLRMIYGPDYLDALDVLRQRALPPKRRMARREHALGLDALTAFVDREPLWRVHQLVAAVLALESEPVDPRL